MLTQADLTAYVDELWRTEDAAEQQPDLWERRRRCWAGRPHDRAPHVAEMCGDYEEATGSLVGCD